MNNEYIISLLQNGQTLFGLRVSTSRVGLSSKWKFLVPVLDNPEGSTHCGIRDVTGLVARALGKKWDDKNGTMTIRGGNGHDVVTSLSIALFNNHDSIKYQSI